jgi:hypothetical protein
VIKFVSKQSVNYEHSLTPSKQSVNYEHSLTPSKQSVNYEHSLTPSKQSVNYEHSLILLLYCHVFVVIHFVCAQSMDENMCIKREYLI